MFVHIPVVCPFVRTGHEYISYYTIEVFTQKVECGGLAVIHKYDNIHRVSQTVWSLWCSQLIM